MLIVYVYLTKEDYCCWISILALTFQNKDKGHVIVWTHWVILRFQGLRQSIIVEAAWNTLLCCCYIWSSAFFTQNIFLKLLGKGIKWCNLRLPTSILSKMAVCKSKKTSFQLFKRLFGQGHEVAYCNYICLTNIIIP